MTTSGHEKAGTASEARVLVIGGNGFIGRHVRTALAAAGYDVLSLGRTPRPGTLHADVAGSDPADLAALFVAHRIGCIVNAAGEVWGPTDGRTTHHSNVTLVERLLAAVVRVPRPVRLVHLGSGYEYGPSPYGSVLDESVPPRPVSPYARTKLQATRLVLAAAGRERDQVDAVVLRVACTIGPQAPAGSLLGTLAARLRAADGPLELEFRSLDSEQGFVDVRDVADAVVAAVGAESLSPRLFNIGAERTVPVRDLVHRLIELSGAPVAVRERPDPSARRGSGIDWQLLGVGSARRALGWRPVRGPEEALRDLWQSPSNA